MAFLSSLQSDGKTKTHPSGDSVRPLTVAGHSLLSSSPANDVALLPSGHATPFSHHDRDFHPRQCDFCRGGAMDTFTHGPWTNGQPAAMTYSPSPPTILFLTATQHVCPALPRFVSATITLVQVLVLLATPCLLRKHQYQICTVSKDVERGMRRQWLYHKRCLGRVSACKGTTHLFILF
jgi:hypothetical protein